MTLRGRLFRAQKGKCFYCEEGMMVMGNVNHPLFATYDHVVPKSLGGGRDGNIILAHKACNERKGDAHPTETLLARFKTFIAEQSSKPPTSHTRATG